MGAMLNILIIILFYKLCKNRAIIFLFFLVFCLKCLTKKCLIKTVNYYSLSYLFSIMLLKFEQYYRNLHINL